MLLAEKPALNDRENLNGHRYMATGQWSKKTITKKRPDRFRTFSPVFACFQPFSHFVGCLFLTLFGRPFSHHSPAAI